MLIWPDDGDYRSYYSSSWGEHISSRFIFLNQLCDEESVSMLFIVFGLTHYKSNTVQ